MAAFTEKPICCFSNERLLPHREEPANVSEARLSKHFLKVSVKFFTRAVITKTALSTAIQCMNASCSQFLRGCVNFLLMARIQNGYRSLYQYMPRGCTVSLKWLHKHSRRKESPRGFEATYIYLPCG